MLQPRVMPCLLVQDGRLVKTVRYKAPVYVGDPVNAIKIFNDKEVDELVVLDIDASKRGHPPNFELVSQIANECFMPVAYGGGIKSVSDARTLFSLGIEKIILNSIIGSNPELVRELAQTFGSQSIVASIDVKAKFLGGYTTFILNGSKALSLSPIDLAAQMESLGAGELLVNSIDREGTWSGIDIPLIRSISARVGVPIIASGGAGTIGHIRDAIHDGGAAAVAIGSMTVFQGKGLGVLINFPHKTALDDAFRR